MPCTSRLTQPARPDGTEVVPIQASNSRCAPVGQVVEYSTPWPTFLSRGEARGFVPSACARMTHRAQVPPPRMAARSSLVLLVSEADQVVGPVRLAHDPVAALGVLAHVTLLFPFVPAARVDDAVLARLADQFAHAPG